MNVDNEHIRRIRQTAEKLKFVSVFTFFKGQSGVFSIRLLVTFLRNFSRRASGRLLAERPLTCSIGTGILTAERKFQYKFGTARRQAGVKFS
jgi:hypothetical protein